MNFCWDSFRSSFGNFIPGLYSKDSFPNVLYGFLNFCLSIPSEDFARNFLRRFSRDSWNSLIWESFESSFWRLIHESDLRVCMYVCMCVHEDSYHPSLSVAVHAVPLLLKSFWRISFLVNLGNSV